MRVPLGKLPRGHPERGVNAQRVVPMNREIYLCHQLTQGFEALRITEVGLELGIEGLLVAVLPRTTRFAARDSDTCALKESTE